MIPSVEDAVEDRWAFDEQVSKRGPGQCRTSPVVGIMYLMSPVRQGFAV